MPDIFSWDRERTPASKRAGTRRELANLLDSYSDDADIIAEIVQNAIDAIAAFTEQAEADYVGKLTVVLGRRDNNPHYIYVQDNGIGMDREELGEAFQPGFSAKEQGQSIGYKGVGLSYVVGASTHLSVRTVRDEERTDLTVRLANEWVNDDEAPDPLQSDEFSVPPLIYDLSNTIESGTGVYFAFHAGANPGSLDNMVKTSDGTEKELEYWASLLSSRTAVGIAKYRASETERPIEVEIILDRGAGDPETMQFLRSSYDLESRHLGYPFPHLVFQVGADTEFLDRLERSQLPEHYRRYSAVYRWWTGEEMVGRLSGLSEGQETLLSEHLAWVYAYLGYRVTPLDRVWRLMGTRRKTVRWGGRLAVDGVPQGRPLALALTSDQGLDRQSHIVLGFDGLNLDLGRKIISDPTIADLVDRVTSSAVEHLKGYRSWHLKVPDRDDVQTDIDSWVEKINERAGTTRMPEVFESEGLKAPLLVEPQEEQEVIGIWMGLLTSGFLQGYQMRAISSSNRYDALLNIGAEAFSDEGKLGCVDANGAETLNAVLEFKILFESILSDFDSRQKNPNEIDLIVCWGCSSLNIPRGRLEPVYGEWRHSRPMRAVSYIWTDANNASSIPVIALRNVIAELLALGSVEDAGGALSDLEARDADQAI